MIKITPVIFFFTLLVFCLLQCTFLPTKKGTNALLTPEEAIVDIKIEEGFEIRPVAAEPLIEDPVALQFDEDGRMWIVEMRGYMQDKDGYGETLPLGRIKIAEDADDDGTYETAAVFMDSLIMPRAVAPVKGGILLIEPPGLYFVENSGGKAGKKIVIDSLFADGGNAEHQPNGLVRAMDNWIYCAKSDKRIRFVNNKWVIENTQARGQWGLSQDDWGRLFYNDNSTILMGDNFLPNAFGINDAYGLQSKNTYGARLAGNAVFPRRRTPGVNRGYEKGTLDTAGKLASATAACGPVIYRGDNFPEAYRGNAFVMEPSAYLIKRIILNRDSNNIAHGSFAHDSTEFLTATDDRFRPVNGYTAPDGSLYFIDMHRGIIQHTTYLTPYLRHYIDSLKLDRPIGMGRIYRIKWKAHGLSKKLRLSHFSPTELVHLLEHKNGWYRDMAQRLLTDRADTTVVQQLKTLSFHQNEITAAHALYTLEGLNALTPQLLQEVAQASVSKHVYLNCMKLLEGFPDDKKALDILKNLAEKEDRFVALQAVNSLPYFDKRFRRDVKKSVLESLEKYPNDIVFTDAMLSGISGNEAAWLKTVGAKNERDTTLRNALITAVAKRKQARHKLAAWLTKPEAQLYYGGEQVYKRICATCHGPAGDGIINVAPPLVSSEWVLQTDVSVPIRILLDGMSGAIEVAGKHYRPPEYNGAMPGLRNNIETSNGSLASVLTFIRNAWGNKASAITVEHVAAVRKKTEGRKQSYTADDLRKTSIQVANPTAKKN